MGEYTDDNGKKVTTEAVLGKGGEGTVYAVKGRAKFVAKIFHPQHRTAERADKIELMVRRPPTDPTRDEGHTSITWPTSALHENGEFAGFLMPKIVNPINILSAYHPQERDRTFENFHWGHSTHTAMNMCLAVAAIHQLGYVIGDINESNVLVTDRALVTLVDTDSFQVTDPQNKRVYRTTVGKGEYLPPELHGVSLDMVTRQDTQDRFGLAIVIFKLLMEGSHPFNSLPDPADPSGYLVYELNIIRGIFPYAPNSPRQPSPAAPPFNILHPQLQTLFLQCFGEGHSQPERRPTALEWAAALGTAEADLKVCRKNRKSHRYASHLDKCPWCAREEARAQAAAAQQGPPIATQKPMSSSGLKKPSQSKPATQQTPSSSGGRQALPPEATGLSVGGFLLTWLWALFHRLWLSGMVALVAWLGSVIYLADRLGFDLGPLRRFYTFQPYALLALGVMAVYFLLFGRRVAWKKKSWASAETFKSVQRGWAALGLILWAGFLGLSYLLDMNPVGLVAGDLGIGRPETVVVEVTRVAGEVQQSPAGDEAETGDAPASSAGDEADTVEVVPVAQGERPEVRVRLNAANVRAGPGEAFAVIGRVTRDTLLPVIATDAGRGWYNVELPDGDRAWIGSSTVEVIDSLGDVPVAATIPAP